jgi:integrase/recombinase XerD
MRNNKKEELAIGFEKYLRNSRYSENTIYNYLLDIRNFLKVCNFEPNGNSNLFKKAIEDYLKKIQTTLSPRSIYRHTRSLKCFFKFLLINEYITQMPTLPNFKFVPKLPERLDDEDIRKIFAACTQVPNPYRMKAIISLLYGCGLRVSELVGIKMSDCDFNTKFIKVLGKNRKERIIPLSDKILSIIKMYIEKERRFFKYASTSEYLFLSKKKDKITRVQVFNLLKKLQYIAGIEKNIYPHLLRHSFATKLLENGVSLRVIQELLGHSKLSTTTVYTHIDYRKLQEIYDKYF